MISGAELTVLGSVLLGTLAYDTNLVLVGIYMAVLGAGLGMLMQNLVLVVQNSIEVKNLGVATSAVTFFRSLGGTVGVSVLGSVLGTIVASEIKDGISALAPADQAAAAAALGSGSIPKVSELPDAIAVLVETAYGVGVGSVFLYSVPLAVVTLLAVIFIPNASLGRQNAVQLKKAAASAAPGRQDTSPAPSAAELALADVATGSVALVDPVSPVRTANPEHQSR
jgi:hypothetical protein